jgi:tetratricopeptide (TPR) repeat protein
VTSKKIKSTTVIGTTFAALFLISATCILVNCESGHRAREGEKIKTATPEHFIGATECKACHTKEYNDWRKSDHFSAMQPATDSTVLGDFNNTTYAADGVTNKFFKKDGKFHIQTQGDDGKDHDYEIVYTFGVFPLQQYLVSFPGGRLQSTRASWNSRDKKWFHQYSGQKIYHHDWLHWTGNSQNWNTMCASCHSTDLHKNYDFNQDSYNTTWSEINVSCESCHGPGGGHVSFVQSAAVKEGEHLPNAGLWYGKNTKPQLQLNTCATCHARKADLSSTLLHTDEIMDDLIPQVIGNEFYFPDGQIREEDYEYGSFAQSKMFHNNVRCSSCHNPHSGKLILPGNALCMTCHKPKYDTKEHHFHMINTEGSQCINCHMATKTYMGVDHRRDHSFRIPRPDQSVVYGTPNACTSCHKDKSASWAANVINKNYGDKRAYHFSDDLLPGSQLTDKSETHLIKLLGDTTQPEIARATAANYLANIQTPTTAEALTRALHDKRALVRYHAIRALENFPPQVWQSAAQQTLTDKVRAVRIAAADLFHRLPAEAIPASVKGAYFTADTENRKYLQYQTDFAVGNVMLADYELQGGDQLNAILHYLRGLKKDSLMNYARLNLSAAYSNTGKNPEALEVLQQAAAIDQSNDRIFYNLGLLYYELQNIPSALTNFDKATRLGSTNPGVYYNYGLLLQQQEKLKEAEQILLRGYALSPAAANINYALAYLYLRENHPQKARLHAKALQKMDPSNPDYQQLFKNLGL